MVNNFVFEQSSIALRSRGRDADRRVADQQSGGYAGISFLHIYLLSGSRFIISHLAGSCVGLPSFSSPRKCRSVAKGHLRQRGGGEVAGSKENQGFEAILTNFPTDAARPVQFSLSQQSRLSVDIICRAGRG
jgi:hypothetical protein